MFLGGHVCSPRMGPRERVVSFSRGNPRFLKDGLPRVGDHRDTLTAVAAEKKPVALHELLEHIEGAGEILELRDDRRLLPVQVSDSLRRVPLKLARSAAQRVDVCAKALERETASGSRDS